MIKKEDAVSVTALHQNPPPAFMPVEGQAIACLIGSSVDPSSAWWRLQACESIYSASEELGATSEEIGCSPAMANALVPRELRTGRGQSADTCVLMLSTCAAVKPTANACNATKRQITPSHTMSRQPHASSVTAWGSCLVLGGAA